jgi:hypothetical protein
MRASHKADFAVVANQRSPGVRERVALEPGYAAHDPHSPPCWLGRLLFLGFAFFLFALMLGDLLCGGFGCALCDARIDGAFVGRGLIVR